MNLEFELKEVLRKDGRILYEVLRKGLSVGNLFLEEPYGLNRQEAKGMQVN